MDYERQSVVSGLKIIIFRQYDCVRSGRGDGRICVAVELKVVGNPIGDAGQLDTVSCTNTNGDGKRCKKNCVTAYPTNEWKTQRHPWM